MFMVDQCPFLLQASAEVDNNTSSQIYKLHGFIPNLCEICYFMGVYPLNMNVMHYLNTKDCVHIFMCTPEFLDGLKCESKGENNGREGVGVRSLVHNTSGV